MADASTPPSHTNRKSPTLLGMDLTTTGGSHPAAWATVVEGRKNGVARGFAVRLLGPTAAAWARMGGQLGGWAVGRTMGRRWLCVCVRGEVVCGWWVVVEAALSVAVAVP